MEQIKPTIEHCHAELANGYIGQIEYHLHKDNSWVAMPFSSLKDKTEKVRLLESQGYNIDRFIFFEPQITNLENPQLTVSQKLETLVKYLQSIDI